MRSGRFFRGAVSLYRLCLRRPPGAIVAQVKGYRVFHHIHDRQNTCENRDRQSCSNQHPQARVLIRLFLFSGSGNLLRIRFFPRTGRFSFNPLSAAGTEGIGSGEACAAIGTGAGFQFDAFFRRLLTSAAAAEPVTVFVFKSAFRTGPHCIFLRFLKASAAL